MSNLFKAQSEAKGVGSGHNGTGHFIAQRASAVILIPLVLYFLYAVVRLTGAESYADVIAWFGNPFNAGAALMLIIIGFYHGALGVQVVIEDYVHCEKGKWLSIIIMRGLCVFFALVAVVAILRMAVLALALG